MPPITETDWETLSTELPLPNSAVITSYLASRTALKTEELKQRSDHSFRTNLSPIARRACEIVSRIRDVEKQTIWTPALEEQLANDPESGVQGPVFPGMMFGLAKGLMEGTTLWGIVRRMPKGSLLRMYEFEVSGGC